MGKLELGDDPGWSGSYDLDFRVENLGSDTLSYSMKAVLLRPDTAEQDGKTMVLASDVLIREVDLGSVSVPPAAHRSAGPFPSPLPTSPPSATCSPTAAMWRAL